MRKLTLFLICLVLLFAVSCAKKDEVRPAAQYNMQESFARANELIAKKYYNEARRELELIKSRDTEMKYAPLAHLRIADTYLGEKEPEPAVEEYRKFLVLYPSHKYASYAMYQIGMVYYKQIEDYERGPDAAKRALKEFMDLNERYPRNPYRQNTVLYIKVSRRVLARHAFMVGEYYFKRKSYRPAVQRFAELLSQYPESDRVEETLYRLAVGHDRLGEKEQSQKYLNRLLTEYPKGDFAEKAKKDLAEPAEKDG